MNHLDSLFVRVCGGLTISALLPVTGALAAPALDLDGRPRTFEVGRQSGVAVFREGSRLHVLFTSADKARLFQGKLCSRGELTGLAGDGLEQPDSLKLSPERKCVWFKFRTGSDADGFVLDFPSQWVVFEPRDGRTALAPQQIWVGLDGRHPDQTPLTFESR